MEILKFTLKGRTAFFKMPDVNSYFYFSYNNIHKVALLGMFGAILGYDGYNNQKDKECPEFYEKLQNLKISIIPNSKMGDFSKKIQYFNNSVGYASLEEGGNLIVKEQWLEDVSWDILIKIENTELHQELKKRLLQFKFEYNIYLGKNDHMANIENVEILEGENFEGEISRIDSLFLKNSVGEAAKESKVPIRKNREINYKYQEKLPLRLHLFSNQYEVESFIFTNLKYNILNKENFIKVKEKLVEFY